MFVAGLWVYLRTARARGALGHVSLWSFVALILFLYASDATGAPPPDERSLALFALLGWIVVPWAWWIERTRELRRSEPVDLRRQRS